MEAIKIFTIAALLCVATIHQADAQYFYSGYPAYYAPSYYYPSYAYAYSPYIIGKRSAKFRSLKEEMNLGAIKQ